MSLCVCVCELSRELEKHRQRSDQLAPEVAGLQDTLAECRAPWPPWPLSMCAAHAHVHDAAHGSGQRPEAVKAMQEEILLDCRAQLHRLMITDQRSRSRSPGWTGHRVLSSRLLALARSGGLKCPTASHRLRDLSSRKELAELKTQHARREELRANEQPLTRPAYCIREGRLGRLRAWGFRSVWKD